MRILVINPNTTASMTESIGLAANRAAAEKTQAVAINPALGPTSIQGRADGEAALPGLIEVFEAEVCQRGGYDAAIIACFDDTGLAKLRERSPVPVFGIGEAAYFKAARLAPPFSVITTLDVSIDILRENVKSYGLANHCAGVRASGIPVLDLEAEPKTAIERIDQEIATAIREDGCNSIVLGCAGMTQFVGFLERKHQIPIVEGIAAAVERCEA